MPGKERKGTAPEVFLTAVKVFEDWEGETWEAEGEFCGGRRERVSKTHGSDDKT